MKKFLIPGFRITFSVLFFICVARSLYAEVPPLREQISLNGKWNTDNGLIEIPQYYGDEFTDFRSFYCEVQVPKEWAGKQISLEFMSVVHMAEVFVNEIKVAENWGGWTPFSVDLTNKVNPGDSFKLQVKVGGSDCMLSADGKVVRPVGGWIKKAGIADDVFLRAYGSVSVRDAFIKTSVSKKTFSVEYSIRNSENTKRKVEMEGEVIDPETNLTVHKFSKKIDLSARDEKTINIESVWNNPELYWPDRPKLYYLKTKMMNGAKILDEETRRFGFREIAIKGNQIYWNNIRINLYGSYETFADDWYGPSKIIHSKENFPLTADEMQDMNIRCVRWHHNPVPTYILDICDEKGLLVCSESPNYARDFHKGMNANDIENYIKNFIAWAPDWIRAERNHPSIYIFNVTNEKTHSFCERLTGDQCRRMGVPMRQNDPTRLIGYDGDVPASEELINYHYPEGYDKQPVGSIYSWEKFVKPNQPTGTGEVFHAKKPESANEKEKYNCERNKWWMGIWMRGLRYSNWTDVRPACFWFASEDLKSCDPKVRVRGENLKNAYSPVALFDKEYDDLGISPFVWNLSLGGTLPILSTGNSVTRTLVLYNDEFQNEKVKIRVSFKAKGQIVLLEEKEITLALGEHKEITLNFALPSISIKEIHMVLETFKNDKNTFHEERLFNLENSNSKIQPFLHIID